MNYLIEIIIVTLLAVIAFQDFKQRQISWVLIPLLFILFSFLSVKQTGDVKSSLLFFSVNCVFIFFQLLFLTIYFSLKQRKLSNIINSYIGIGDVLFFIVVAITFSPVNFIVFYVGSLVFTVIGAVFFRLSKQAFSKEIPLAGFMSLMLVICLIYKNLHHGLNFYDDDWVIKLMVL